MRIYDVSVPISVDLPTYPGDPGIQIGSTSSIANGDAANVSKLDFGAHTGTHVDAPAHFIQGARKLDSLPLDVLIGEAEVVELPADAVVIEEQFVIDHCPTSTSRVLFKTRNSQFWNTPSAGFRKDFTYLDAGAARRLVANGIKLVGIDYLSIEAFGNKSHDTHLALLSNDVVIIEGLALANVPAGKYELICLPLRIASGHGDGSPARVVLRTTN